MPFVAKRSGAADATTTFALSAASTVPGGSVSLDRGSVSLGGDATNAVIATVTVPAGAPAGTYDVTLTGTADGKPQRAGVAHVTVKPPAAQPGPSPAPAPTATATPDTTAPVLRSASLKRKRFRARSGTTLRLEVSEAASLRALVERLVPGRGSGGRCSSRARTGRRCTIVKRARTTAATLGSGAHSVRAFGRRLKPGRYRVALQATDAAGNRSAVARRRFTVRR